MFTYTGRLLSHPVSIGAKSIAAFTCELEMRGVSSEGKGKWCLNLMLGSPAFQELWLSNGVKPYAADFDWPIVKGRRIGRLIRDSVLMHGW